METLEQLKEIVKNAHGRATHVQIVEDENQYFESNGFGFWCLNSDCQVSGEDIVSVRSLSDIKLIIELMEDKKKAWKAYVALEEIKQKYNGENKIAKELLKLAYECDEFALPSDLRKDIKNFIGDL